MATLVELDGVAPTIGADVWLAPTAVLIGDVRVADPVNVWFGAVLRGDESHITIEEVVAAVPIGDSADVELAVATAKRAFPEWAAKDAEAWAHTLAKAASLIEERAAELAAILTSEQGKSIAEARGEVTHLAHGVRCYAEAATKVRGAYQELPSAFGPAYGQVIRRPMGVCSRPTTFPSPCWEPRSRRRSRVATRSWQSQPPPRRWPRSRWRASSPKRACRTA
jgi:hypothetical protein